MAKSAMLICSPCQFLLNYDNIKIVVKKLKGKGDRGSGKELLKIQQPKMCSIILGNV